MEWLSAFVTYICAEYVRVLAVVGDNDPGLGGFGEHLLAQLACTATLDAVEAALDAVDLETGIRQSLVRTQYGRASRNTARQHTLAQSACAPAHPANH